MQYRLTRLVAASLFVLAAAAGAQAPAQEGGFVLTPTDKSVDAAFADLKAAVAGAGATIFAEVDHAAGARSVEMDLPAARLLIFGNPRLGTPAMRDDMRAGALLPLRVLVYAGPDGGTVIAYEDPAAMFAGLEIPADAAYLGQMQGALAKLTGAAAGA